MIADAHEIIAESDKLCGLVKKMRCEPLGDDLKTPKLDSNCVAKSTLKDQINDLFDENEAELAEFQSIRKYIKEYGGDKFDAIQKFERNLANMIKNDITSSGKNLGREISQKTIKNQESIIKKNLKIIEAQQDQKRSLREFINQEREMFQFSYDSHEKEAKSLKLQLFDMKTKLEQLQCERDIIALREEEFRAKINELKVTNVRNEGKISDLSRENGELRKAVRKWKEFVTVQRRKEDKKVINDESLWIDLMEKKYLVVMLHALGIEFDANDKDPMWKAQMLKQIAVVIQKMT